MKIKHLLYSSMAIIVGLIGAKAVGAFEITESQKAVICQLQEGAKKAENLGYELVYWPVVNRALSAARAPIRLRLHSGVEYVFIGYCDDNCTDANLFLSNAEGEVVAADEESDDFPTISYTSTEGAVYEIALQVSDCSSEEGCMYGMGILAKKGANAPNTSRLPSSLAQFQVCN